MLCELIACSLLSLNNIPFYARTTVCLSISHIEGHLVASSLGSYEYKAATNSRVNLSSGCYITKYRRWSGLQQFISQSLETGSLRSGGQYNQVLGESSLLGCRLWLLLYPHMAECREESKPYCDCCKGTNPILRTLPHDLIYSQLPPKAHTS